MNFTSLLWSFKTKLSEEKITTIRFENLAYYRKTINLLLKQISGQDEGFHLFDAKKSFSFTKDIDMITDIFKLDINKKVAINKIIKDVKEEMLKNQIETQALLNNIYLFFEKYIENFRIDIYQEEDITLDALLKLLQIKIFTNEENPIDELISYMQVSSQILNTKVFIITNIKHLLDQEELYQLFHTFIGNKWCILLLETEKTTNLNLENPYEKVYIIDKDLCEL
ncbi:MAG: type II-A CRISPR-associated protein Csn2 [Christensenellales bacterium]|jgi:CRISPR type II-A-associated protein Csn2